MFIFIFIFFNFDTVPKRRPAETLGRSDVLFLLLFYFQLDSLFVF